jgi:hypothetical protein
MLGGGKGWERKKILDRVGSACLWGTLIEVGVWVRRQWTLVRSRGAYIRGVVSIIGIVRFFIRRIRVTIWYNELPIKCTSSSIMIGMETSSRGQGHITKFVFFLSDHIVL